MQVVIRGEKEITSKFNKITSYVKKSLRKAVYQAAVLVRNDARVWASIVKPRSGKRVGTKYPHKMLWKSIKVVTKKEKEGAIGASVAATAPHAHIVELGTQPRYRGLSVKPKAKLHIRRSKIKLSIINPQQNKLYVKYNTIITERKKIRGREIIQKKKVKVWNMGRRVRTQIVRTNRKLLRMKSMINFNMGVKKGFTGIMPKKPYMEPAIKLNLKKCEQIILDGAKQGIGIV